MTPWPDDILHETLLRSGYPSDRIASILPRCGGNIGTALELLDENRLDSEAQAFVSEALSISSDANAVSLSTRMKESRDGAEACLSALETAIHQAILVRVGQLDSAAMNTYPPLWQKAAQAAPVSDLNALLTAVFETRRRKAGQVNWQSNIDHLLMTLLEEHTKWQQSLA